MVTKQQINDIMEEHGDAWCEACDAYARTKGEPPNNAHDGSPEYWHAYNEKWDELCPEFNPITGRGY